MRASNAPKTALTIISHIRLVFAPTVVNFVTAKAPEFNRVQQTSTSRPQTVQQESLRIHRVLQGSTRLGIWFGTRRPVGQIHSPRPIVFNDICRSARPQTQPSGFGPGVLARISAKNKELGLGERA